MTRTGKMELSLPAGNDYVDVQVLSENFRKIDAHTHCPGDLGAATTATYTVTIPTAWVQSGALYYQDITDGVQGMLSTDNPVPGVAYGTDNDANLLFEECFGKLFRITTSNNSIRVWAKEAISTAFPIQLKVVR